MRAKSRKTRVSTFTESAPTEWQPRSVLDPRAKSDEYFTDDSAWEFIALQIEVGVGLKKIELQKPANKIGYVFLVPDEVRKKNIYIKLQLLSASVLGRSFHYSK